LKELSGSGARGNGHVLSGMQDGLNCHAIAKIDRARVQRRRPQEFVCQPVRADDVAGREIDTQHPQFVQGGHFKIQDDLVCLLPAKHATKLIAIEGDAHGPEVGM